jgi:hypothetical protein
VGLIRHFKLSDDLKAQAEDLKLESPRVIDSVPELRKNLLDPRWRFLPMQWDIPANSQLFGQIVMEAGINGIVYPSVISGEDCLAIFPKTFTDSQAYVETIDIAPVGATFRRLDSKTHGDSV